MKTRKAKIMALMAAATFEYFFSRKRYGGGKRRFLSAAGESDWEDAHTEGAYASFTNGSDYVNIYKYAWTMPKSELRNVMIPMKHAIRRFFQKGTACIWR
mgnify:CR=1 FL=1